MIHIRRCGYWLGSMVSTSLLAAPLPAKAQLTPSTAPSPLVVEVDYVPDHRLIPDATAYVVGGADDYLPSAAPKASEIVLRLSERRVYVYDGDRVLDSYPVAIGTSNTPTPTGEFEVFQMIVEPSWQSPWTGEVFPPGPLSALGLRWIGFTELPNGVIGFHGTPTLASIGQAASNGCVRLRNEDVLALFEHVRMGMTVVVEP